MASPTISTLSGFAVIIPMNDSLPPSRELTSELIIPPSAMGKLSLRDESYMKVGLTKILRRFGSSDDMMASASLFVVMYLWGRSGAPAAADMNTKVVTFSFVASCAKETAAQPIFVSACSEFWGNMILEQANLSLYS